MRDGDIYDWEWKEEPDTAQPYWCYSRRAVVRNGKLVDTYWGRTEPKSVTPEKVNLTFVANFDDLEEIGEWKIRYYKTSDIVDMRHANSSNAKVYRRKGAKRDPETMIQHAQDSIRECEAQIQSDQRQIDFLKRAISLVEAGKIDEAHL